jgi:DNA-3-methyladenine glycosylase
MIASHCISLWGRRFARPQAAGRKRRAKKAHQAAGRRPEVRPTIRAFYERQTLEVARDLVGKVLVHGAAAGIIVETEAYPGRDDLASHSARGITDRTRVIFGPPGHAYVYLIYGMYECLNLVAEPDGQPGCVLLRAIEPVSGIELMQRRRPAARKPEELASGPGKLTRALGVTLAHYGADVTRGPLVVRQPAEPRTLEIVATPRININHCIDLPYRFIARGNRFVSRGADS